MKEQTKARIELFSANTMGLKGKFIWQNTLLKRLAALLYALEDKPVDPAAIRASYELIKKNTGLLSAFRGNSAMTISALLSLKEDREKMLTDTLNVYHMLKAHQFRASEYLVVAACQIAANTSEDKYIQIVERAKAFYEGIKEAHFFLTGHDDYIFAAMLGLSDVEVSTGLMRMDQLFNTFKPYFHSGRGVQALTQVIVLCGENTDAETRVLNLRDGFRRNGLRLDREYTLSTLGVLALLPADIDAIIHDVSEAYDFLRTQKGFGKLSVSKQELLLFSAALVAMEYVSDAKNGIMASALMTSLTDIIIAQETVIAVAAATTAVAASSGSHS